MRQLLLAGALLAAATAAGATSLEDARDNFETAVRTYVGSRSRGDYLVSRLHGKKIRLTLSGIERDTVHRSSGRWRGIADFTQSGTKREFWADVTADLSSDLWDVKQFRWLSRREAAEARVTALAAAGAAKTPREPGPAGLLPDLVLPSLDGKEAYLPECSKAKCLTVVVAPWCPHCRNASGVIAALGDFLPAHDVGMRVIVAADSEEKVRDFAKLFGPGTLIDPDSTFKVPGFPCYIVSTNGGAILSQGGNAPENEKDPASFASAIGLP